MANTLNNFGLAEKTLNTAGKWCAADISFKISSAEIENIKREYFRNGTRIFGMEGRYGTPKTQKIPAGIYEIVMDTSPFQIAVVVSGVEFYHRGTLYNTLTAKTGELTFNTTKYKITEGSSSSNPSGTKQTDNTALTWLDYLVYVPNDVELPVHSTNVWFELMHPYVQSKFIDEAISVIPNVDILTEPFNVDLKFSYLTSAACYTCKGLKLTGSSTYTLSYIESDGARRDIWNSTSGLFGGVSSYMIIPSQEIDPKLFALLISSETSIAAKHKCSTCASFYYLKEFARAWTCTSCYAAIQYCPNCGTENYSEADAYCNDCYYPYRGECSIHGAYNKFYSNKCPSCNTFICYDCDGNSSFSTQQELIEHKQAAHCRHEESDEGTLYYAAVPGTEAHVQMCSCCGQAMSPTESCTMVDNYCSICGNAKIYGTCGICGSGLITQADVDNGSAYFYGGTPYHINCYHGQ